MADRVDLSRPHVWAPERAAARAAFVRRTGRAPRYVVQVPGQPYWAAGPVPGRTADDGPQTAGGSDKARTGKDTTDD